MCICFLFDVCVCVGVSVYPGLVLKIAKMYEWLVFVQICGKLGNLESTLRQFVCSEGYSRNPCFSNTANNTFHTPSIFRDSHGELYSWFLYLFALKKQNQCFITLLFLHVYSILQSIPAEKQKQFPMAVLSNI